jgi:transketolase
MRKTGLNTIYECAKEDKNIVFIGSDLGPGTLDNFKEEMPNQFYMEGISEAHVLSMAAGLALEGDRVYVNTIASFLTRRSLEQLALDICAENLNVTLYGNGGGLVYGPLGHSHTAVDDFGLMLPLPNITVLAPSDANEMSEYIRQSANHNGPIYIRLGKGGDPIVTKGKEIKIGKPIFFDNGSPENLIITTGIMLQRSIDVAKEIGANILHYGSIKPFDRETLKNKISANTNIIILEEHLKHGGLGSITTQTLVEDNIDYKSFHHFNLGENYIDQYGRQEELFDHLGLNPEAIIANLKAKI